MSWSRDDPIELPDGQVLRTLRDAGHYVTALNKADQAKLHWQTAAHELMMAAERGGILMLAEIAMRQALAHGRPTSAATPRKKAAKNVRDWNDLDRSPGAGTNLRPKFSSLSDPRLDAGGRVRRALRVNRRIAIAGCSHMQKLFFQIRRAIARSRVAVLSSARGINLRGAPCSPTASLRAP
jgi:hypothetical protein